MLFLHKTVKGIAPLRSFILLIVIFALTWSSFAIASCHKASDDCASSTTHNKPCEFQYGASVQQLDETETISTNAVPDEPSASCQPARTFPFAAKLRGDQCEFTINESIGKRSAEDVEPVVVKLVYDGVVETVAQLKDSVKRAFKIALLDICKDTRFFPLTKIPLQQDLQDLSTAKGLLLYYSTLLNHTAHLQHIGYQLQKYDRTCSKDFIPVFARRLTQNIRKLTCFIRLLMLAAYDEYNNDSFLKPSTEVLDVFLCDETSCSRRALHDCRVVENLNNILMRFESFINTQMQVDRVLWSYRILNPDIQEIFERVLKYPDDW